MVLNLGKISICFRKQRLILATFKTLKSYSVVAEEVLPFKWLFLLGWLVCCFGLNGPSRQYFSLYRAVSRREGEGKEK